MYYFTIHFLKIAIIPGTTKIKVMLADDHEAFRRSVKEGLEQEPGEIVIIGEASNGEELLKLMEQELPDIVLLDLEMPVLDGHKTLEAIQNRFPGVKTIILSVHYHEYYIAQLLLLGAAGYLPKQAFHETILKTIKMVYEEGFYFNEYVSRELLLSVLEDGKQEYFISERILSEREIETLKAICNGRTYKQAAAELNISVDTVKFHIKSIYRKTQSNSIAELVKYAIKVGITTVS